MKHLKGLKDLPARPITPEVYIVDDDKNIGKSLKRLMKSMGIRAESFSTAEDFLNFGFQDKPGCLILDVRMPGMNGLELQRRLLSSGSKIPVIFISAHEDERVNKAAMAAGALAFFLKPFDDQKLLDAIHQAFGQIRKYFNHE